MRLAIFLCMITAAVGTTDFLQTIEPGIYKEGLGKVLLITDNAEVWIRIDDSSIRSELDLVSAFGNKIDESCRKSVLPDVACDSFRNLSKSIEANIEEKFDKMTLERSRRGLINFIGSTSKFLFGTMDSEDSERLNDKIGLLFDENGRTLDFKAKYTEIVEKTVSRLNSTNDVVNHHSHALDLIEEKLKILKQESGAAREAYMLLGLKNSYLTIIQAIQEKIGSIHQMLVDLHGGILNTKFISYLDILKAMKNIKIEDKTTKWPFDLDERNHEALRKLLKFAVFSSEKMILVIFTVPFVEIQEYSLQKFYPVPSIIDNTATFAKIETELIIADPAFGKFSTISESEKESNCMAIDSKWFCKNFNLMTTEKESCLGTIMADKSADVHKTCELKVLSLTKTILIKTEDKNKFLAFSGKPTTGKIFLENRTEKLTFDGTQLLTVNEKSTLKVDDWEVKFYSSNRKTELDISIASSWNHNLDGEFGTLSEFAEPSKNVLLSQDFNDLGQDLEKIKDNIRRSSEEKSKKNKSLILEWIAIILAIMFVAFVGIFVYFKAFAWQTFLKCFLGTPEPIEFQRRARGRVTA